MGGWKAVWRPTATKLFKASAIPAASVVVTCGSTTVAGALSYDDNYILYTLPTTANTALISDTGATAVSTATYAATCAAGA
jgi:hypothetical protein